MKNSSSSSLATFEVCRLAIGSAHQTECGQLEEKRTKWARQCAQHNVLASSVLDSTYNRLSPPFAPF